MPQFIAQYNNGPQTFDAASMEDAREHASVLGRALYGDGRGSVALSVNYSGPEHQPAPTGCKLPRAVRDELVRAIRASARERCAVAADAQEEMRLYLDTWVTHPLRNVLRWADGEMTTGQIQAEHSIF